MVNKNDPDKRVNYTLSRKQGHVYKIAQVKGAFVQGTAKNKKEAVKSSDTEKLPAQKGVAGKANITDSPMGNFEKTPSADRKKVSGNALSEQSRSNDKNAVSINSEQYRQAAVMEQKAEYAIKNKTAAEKERIVKAENSPPGNFKNVKNEKSINTSEKTKIRRNSEIHADNKKSEQYRHAAVMEQKAEYMTENAAVRKQKSNEKIENSPVGNFEDVENKENINTAKGRNQEVFTEDNIKDNRKEKYREAAVTQKKQNNFISDKRKEKAAVLSQKLGTEIAAAEKIHHENTNRSVSENSTELKEKAARLSEKLDTEIELSEKASFEAEPKEKAPDKKAQKIDAAKKEEKQKNFDKKEKKTKAEKKNDPYSDKSYQQEAGQAHKIAGLYEKREKLKRQLAKAEKKEANREKAVSAAQNTVEAVSAVASALHEDDAGKAAVHLAAAPAVKAIENAIHKSKTVVGKTGKFIGMAALVAKEADKADDTGMVAVNAVTAVPENIIKEKAAALAKEAFIGKGRTDSIKNSLKKNKAKITKADLKLKLIKENKQREQKVIFYKKAHGLTSGGKNIEHTLRLAISAMKQMPQYFFVHHSTAAIAASAVGILIPILGVIVVLIVIACMFSWTTPHTETLYDPDSMSYLDYELSDQEEILKGYLTHIQQYFDKQQIEILKVVDMDFGGFEPDQYDYTRGVPTASKVFLNESCRTNITVTANTHWSWSWSDGHGHSGGGSDGNSTTSDPVTLINKQFFKYDDYWGDVLCTQAEAEYVVTFCEFGGDYNLYYQYLHDTKHQPLYHIEPSVLVGDISDVTVTKYDESGNAVSTMPAESFIVSEDGINAYMYLMGYVDSTTTSGGGVTSTTSYSQAVTTEINTETKKYAETDDHIWNLNEYGNHWIKLSDDCDFEHIIAMAALLKWQDIMGGAAGSEDYLFEITEADIDRCMDNIFEFYYAYGTGACRDHDCHSDGDGVSCNRAATHKHLKGQVTNFELIGGIDLVLNKILTMPDRRNYSSDKAYNDAVRQFNESKDIYDVYYEYVFDILGTSTHLDDYENDPDARQRLLDMYNAPYGGLPEGPTNIVCSSAQTWCSGYTDFNTNNFLQCTIDPQCKHDLYNDAFKEYSDGGIGFFHNRMEVSWQPPAKTDNVDGYKVRVYEYSEINGKLSLRKESATSDTSCIIDLGGFNARIAAQSYITDAEKYKVLNTTYYVVVTSYNAAGESLKNADGVGGSFNARQDGTKIIITIPYEATSGNLWEKYDT